MFKRVIYDGWTTVVPVISFLLTFSVFAFATLRAVLMPKERRERLASLPLGENETQS